MTNTNFGYAFPQKFPKDIINLISSFAYNRNVREIQERINHAARSYELPVPSGWLRYYTSTDRLNWPIVYDFGSDHTIMISAVAETARLFHWSLMKYSRIVSNTLMKQASKTDVVNTLRNWKRCSASNMHLSELVNLAWLALTGPYTLTKSAYLYNSLRTIQKLTYIDPSALARYYRGNVQLPLRLFPAPNLLSVITMMDL